MSSSIRQAGESGQLYGSVTPRDIADAVPPAGFNVDRSQVVLDQPIKTLGLHGCGSCCIRRSSSPSPSTSPAAPRRPSARPAAIAGRDDDEEVGAGHRGERARHPPEREANSARPDRVARTLSLLLAEVANRATAPDWRRDRVGDASSHGMLSADHPHRSARPRSPTRRSRRYASGRRARRSPCALHDPRCIAVCCQPARCRPRSLYGWHADRRSRHDLRSPRVAARATWLRVAGIRCAISERPSSARRLHQYNPITRSRRNVAHHYDLSERSTTCSSTATGNIPAPISSTRTTPSNRAAQEAPYRRQAAADGRARGARHRLRLGRPGAVSGARMRGRRHRAHAVERAAQGRASAAQRRRACRTASAFTCTTTARRRAASTASSRSACSSMSGSTTTGLFRRCRAARAETGSPCCTRSAAATARRTNPWMRKYIFPGGYSPALSEVCRRSRNPASHDRHRDPAAALRADAAALARQPRAQPRDVTALLRRALLPDVGILPGRKRAALPARRPHGLADAARQAARRGAADPRLHQGSRRGRPSYQHSRARPHRRPSTDSASIEGYPDRAQRRAARPAPSRRPGRSWRRRGRWSARPRRRRDASDRCRCRHKGAALDAGGGLRECQLAAEMDGRVGFEQRRRHLPLGWPRPAKTPARPRQLARRERGQGRRTGRRARPWAPSSPWRRSR